MKRRAAAVCLIAILAVACSRSEAIAVRGGAGDAGAPFDVETMAFLSEARALHHEANVKEEAGDVKGAAEAVTRITRARRPHPESAPPEIEEVIADAWARIAELQLRAGDVAAAERAAKEGLSHAPGPSYFRGHLLEVGGIVQESRAASLADAGDPKGAASARAAAMDLLEEAVKVQDRVIAGALDGGVERKEEGDRP